MTQAFKSQLHEQPCNFKGEHSELSISMKTVEQMEQ